MVARLPLFDNIAPLLICPPVHTLYHISDLLRVQPLQKLVSAQGVCNELFLTGKSKCGEGDTQEKQRQIYLKRANELHYSQRIPPSPDSQSSAHADNSPLQLQPQTFRLFMTS